MEEDLFIKLESSQQTETITEQKTQQSLSDLPRLEDMLKSEKEVKANTEIKGFESATTENFAQDKTFARKKDEKKVYLKRRVKIVTSVYLVIVTLLLTFAGVNLATIATQGGSGHTNDIAITQLAGDVEDSKQAAEENLQQSAAAPFTISLNEPRDYADDYKDLTFFDKFTILFRNIFG